MKNDAQQFEDSLLRRIEDTANWDDRELSNLEKMVSEIGHTGGESILVQKDKLCAALAGFSIDSIKCRLIRTYLATVWSTGDICNTSTVGDDDIEGELRAEVDSLYEEIVPVTEMSIGRVISQLSLLLPCLSVNILIGYSAARHFRE